MNICTNKAITPQLDFFRLLYLVIETRILLFSFFSYLFMEVRDKTIKQIIEILGNLTQLYKYSMV